jgi:lambda family phage tail tape measure protein
MAQGDVEARVVADTSGLQAGMVQAAVVTEAQMKRIAQYVKAANDQTANLGRTSQKAANDTSAAYTTIAAGAKKVEGAHAGVNRELLVLAHEMSQGNYSRFGGSLLVLAERTNFLSFALSGTGALVSAVGAAVLGTAALMAMGAIEADKFAKALQLTGNFAAVTEESVRGLAEAQAKQTGQTAGGARDTITALAGSGLFGPSELATASRAMGDYQHLTRATAEEALKNFSSIQDGVAKWAEEQNKAVHFLTSAEYEHIKSLEDSGQKQAAAIEALNLYAGAIETRGEPAVGSLARAWHSVSDWASRASQAIQDVGRPTDALSASIAAIDRQMQLVKQANTARPQDAAEYLANLAAARAELERQQFRANEHRTDASAAASTHQAAIEADKYIESVLKGAKATSARTEALEKWAAAVQKRAADGNPLSAADVASGRTKINKDFEDHSAVAQANEYSNLVATIKAFNTTTDEEVARMGNLTAGQKFSIQAHEELAKAGKKLTEQQRTEITTAVALAAARRDEAVFLQAAQKAAIARVVADTANQERQQAAVEGVIQSGNDQANAILRQSKLIGKSTEEVLKIQELQKFDDLVGKALLGADNDTVQRINEVAGVIRGNLTSAIDGAKKAQDDWNASFSNGWDKAAREFAKTAANSAAFGEKVFGDFTNGVEDAFVQFAKTGTLSFKSLIDSMISDLVRYEVRQQEMKLLGNGSNGSGGSGYLGAIGGLFAGSGGSSGTGSFADLFSGEFGGGFYANGLDYVPYDGFPAILHEGERVSSRQDAAVERGRGGPSIHIDQSGASYGAGVDPAGVAQIAKAQADRAKSEIFRAISTGRA